MRAIWQNETVVWPPGNMKAVSGGNSLSILSISASSAAMWVSVICGIDFFVLPSSARIAAQSISLLWMDTRVSDVWASISWSRIRPRYEVNSSISPYASIRG